MATTGLYSQHLNNRKVLHLRNTIIAIVLIILAAATLFPICYMILSSFGPNVSTAGNMRTILPSRFTLESFDAFFHFSDHSLRWILNSVVVATGAVIGNVIFASMAGYAFAKIRFKGSKILFGLILVALLSFFLNLSGMSLLINLAGVAVFLGFAAYDTQKIKAFYYGFQYDPVMLKKASVISALQLYLDFINLFLYVLRLFGGNGGSRN